MCDLTNPIFTDENEARKYLHRQRWPNGPICPHCGEKNEITPLKGKAHRPGLYQCNECRGQFSVTVGTVFERSKIPLHKWLLVTHLLSSSKKGISAHQIHRMIGVTYKTAWFMVHRLREAMRDPSPGPMGGSGQNVEADETYFNSKEWQFTNEGGWRRKQGRGKSRAIVALVERGGRARAFHVKDVTSKTLRKVLMDNVDLDSTLQTDEFYAYRKPAQDFEHHETVRHSTYEFVRGDAYTNTVEGFFSIFKRGMKGVYQHCNTRHLQRYLDEFSFRYSHRHVGDAERRDVILKGIDGKRLTYRRPDRRAHNQA